MTADLTALVALMPFAADIGIELEEASADRVVAALPWTARLCTGGGILHGGALMTLADSAGALVTYLGFFPPLVERDTASFHLSRPPRARPVTSSPS